MSHDSSTDLPVSKFWAKKWEKTLVCQKQVSRVGTWNYTPQILRDVITCPCPWNLLLALSNLFRLTKEISKGRIIGLLWGESTGDLWTPHTKAQKCGNHVKTSSSVMPSWWKFKTCGSVIRYFQSIFFQKYAYEKRINHSSRNTCVRMESLFIQIYTFSTRMQLVLCTEIWIKCVF